MELITQVACEVEEVLAHTQKELVDKIPSKVRTFFTEQSKNITEYNSKYNSDIPLENQDLLEETKGVLTWFYRDYWCTEEERIELDKILNENENKYQEELRQKYNPDIFAKNEKIENNNETELRLVEVKQEKWYKRIFQKIKELFWGKGEN